MRVRPFPAFVAVLLSGILAALPAHGSTELTSVPPTVATGADARTQPDKLGATRAFTVTFPKGSAAVSRAERREIRSALAAVPLSSTTVIAVSGAMPRGATGVRARVVAGKRTQATINAIRRSPGFDPSRMSITREAPRRVPASRSNRVRVVMAWELRGAAPTAPRQVSATPGPQRLVVGWERPLRANSQQALRYRAYAIPGHTRPSSWVPFDGNPHCDVTDSLGCTVTGLTAFLPYTVAVVAENEFGVSGPSSWERSPVTPWDSEDVRDSSESGSTLALPGAPGAPRVTASDGEIKVQWAAPATGEGSITGYRVTVATSASGTYANAAGTCSPVTTSTSAATSCTASGLDNGTTYFVRVAAINGAGTGPDSDASLGVTPRGAPGRPAAPSAVAGDELATVSWVAPSDGGGAISGYNVQRSLFGGPYVDQPGCTNLAVTLTCTATGLINGAQVRFRVAARSSAGYGDYSAGSADITPYGRPGAPARPVATAATGSVTVDWAAAPANGSALTGYLVYQATGSAADTYANVTGACLEFNDYPRATTCSLSGLTGGAQYFYKVAAVNAAGEGDRSTASIGVVPTSDAAAPVIEEVVPGNGALDVYFSLSDSSPGTIWSRYSSDDGGNWSTWADSGNRNSPVSIIGLTNGTAYEVQLGVGTASNSLRESGTASATPISPAPPGAPDAPSGVPNDGYVALSWTIPADIGGSAVTGYRVQVATSASGPWSMPSGTCEPSRTRSNTRTSCNATGLTNGITYYFHVAAWNDGGLGAYSASSAAVTPRVVPEQPVAPVGRGGVDQIVVTWSAPATRGSAITGYRLHRATDPAGTFAALSGGGCDATVLAGATAITCTDTDSLVAGGDYYYKVAAISAAGDSPFSNSSGAVSPTSDLTAPTITSATPANRSASIAFSFSGSASNLQYSTDGGFTWTSRSPASTSSPLTVSGLANGTTYEMQIRMVTSSGLTPSSASVTVTPRTTPSSPAAPTGTAGNSQVTLRWTAPPDDGGTPITGYTVQSSTDGSTYADQAGCSSLGLVFTCTATGLTSGTAYTFTVAAINAAGTGAYSPASGPLTPTAATCAAGGTCVLGDTGPGGGTVFYVGSFTLTSTGQTVRYLEAAPANWSGGSDPRVAWSGNTSGNVPTGTAVGTGAANTNAIVGQSDVANRAATLANAYRGGGLSDWFLPSTDEAQQLYVRRGLPGLAGNLETGGYWTSSQRDSSNAWVVFMKNGSQTYNKKSLSFVVRPVRAF